MASINEPRKAVSAFDRNVLQASDRQSSEMALNEQMKRWQTECADFVAA
jgi:hypothetical protein